MFNHNDTVKEHQCRWDVGDNRSYLIKRCSTCHALRLHIRAFVYVYVKELCIFSMLGHTAL